MKRLAAAAFAFAAAAAAAVPSFEQVRAAHAPSDVPLLARDGTVLSVIRTDPSVRRGPWLALADVSPALRDALVLSEDRRFWEHAGVDWRALAGLTSAFIAVETQAFDLLAISLSQLASSEKELSAVLFQRLKDELASMPEVKTWIRKVAPQLLDAFEGATMVDVGMRIGTSETAQDGEHQAEEEAAAELEAGGLAPRLAR